jgi:hypothetical protein
MRYQCLSRPRNHSPRARRPQSLIVPVGPYCVYWEELKLEEVVEAVASARQADCQQELEEHGSIASQRALCEIRSHRCRSTKPAWAGEEPRVEWAQEVHPS